MQRSKRRIIAATAIVLGIVVLFDFFEVRAGPADPGEVPAADAEPAELNGPTSPDKLDLSGTQTTDADLARRLKGLTLLRELRLQNTNITDAGLAHLKGLTSLRELNLDRIRITDMGI